MKTCNLISYAKRVTDLAVKLGEVTPQSIKSRISSQGDASELSRMVMVIKRCKTPVALALLLGAASAKK